MKTGLDRLRDELAGCRACGHEQTIRPIVSLARAPRAMLVGQAPGAVERAGGAPFSGRAGRTLFEWFDSVGLDESSLRSRLYIAAVTRCFPGPHPSGRGDRVPSQTERKRCSEWMTREFSIIRPRLVIPVGRLAIDALVGELPLHEAVGREHALRPDGPGGPRAGCIAIPLPHPSGASSWIHAPGHRRLLDEALALIAARWRALHDGRRAA
jgi:uracil-DNA glycosylase